MKKWQKILATAGVVATLGASLGAGLTGCTKTGENIDYKYLILKQSDRNYTLHCVDSQEVNGYNTKCRMKVCGGAMMYNNQWRFDVKTEHGDGTEMLDACFRCEDEKGVEEIGYEAVCSKCFPNGYEQE